MYADEPTVVAVDGEGFEPGVSIMVVISTTVLFDLEAVELAFAVGELTAGGEDVIGLMTSDEAGGRTEDETKVLCDEVTTVAAGVELRKLGVDNNGLKTELIELGVNIGALGFKDVVETLGVANEVLKVEKDGAELTDVIARLEIKEGA